MKGTIVLDIDGVAVLGSRAIPGAGAALHDLEAGGYHLLFATNNAVRTPREVADRIATVAGYRPAVSRIVTSTIATAAMLRPDDQPVFTTEGPERGMSRTLSDQGIGVTRDAAAARSIVVGLNRSFDYDLLRTAARAVIRGARFIATNTDPTYPTPDGPAPGAGALVAAIATAAGSSPEVAGKPYEPMRRAVAARIPDGAVWMVGDRPETDIAFGRTAGWNTVLVLTGVVSDPANIPVEHRPDVVLPDLASLPAFLAQR